MGNDIKCRVQYLNEKMMEIVWKFYKIAEAVVHVDDFWIYQEFWVVIFAFIQSKEFSCEEVLKI